MVLQHIAYVAGPHQTAITLTALSRLKAQRLDDPAGLGPLFELDHDLLAGLRLRITVLSELNAITPHLRRYPVDLLIYDERGGDAVEAVEAIGRIRRDVREFASHWGPDFIFPMSRVVAILEARTNGEHRAFQLGLDEVRDVLIGPEHTGEVLQWLRNILAKSYRYSERVGLALSGGGLEGFLYQLGALYALETAMDGRSLYSCEVYSGVSSGSIAAAVLATGVPLTEVIKSIQQRSEVLPPLKSSTLFDLAGRRIVERFLRHLAVLPRLRPKGWQSKLIRSLPTGLFRGARLEEYFAECIRSAAGHDAFDQLSNELLVGATDQDTWAHVVFGTSGNDTMPISRAVRASCGLPPVFEPVEIGGRYYVDGQITRSTNLELVIERDCRLIFIVDPLKPVSSRLAGTVDKAGGMHSLIQTIKALVSTRFEMVLTATAERQPHVDFIVLQPDEDCAQAMAGSPMRYRIRSQIVGLAFRSTLRRLRERYPVYSAKLAKYGFRLHDPTRLRSIEREHLPLLENADIDTDGLF